MSVPAIYWPETVGDVPPRLTVSLTPDGDALIANQDNDPAPGVYRAITGSDSLAAAVVATWPGTLGTTLAISVGNGGICTITVGGVDASSTTTIHWSADTETQDLARRLGFSPTGTSTATGSTSAVFVAPNPVRHYWTPGVPPRSTEVEKDRDVVVNEAHGGASTFDRFAIWGGQRAAFEFLPPAVVFTSNEARLGGAIETHLDGDMPGYFRWWDDRDAMVGDDGTAYRLTAESVATFAPRRFSEAVALYSLDLSMRSAT